MSPRFSSWKLTIALACVADTGHAHRIRLRRDHLHRLSDHEQKSILLDGTSETKHIEMQVAYEVGHLMLEDISLSSQGTYRHKLNQVSRMLLALNMISFSLTPFAPRLYCPNSFHRANLGHVALSCYSLPKKEDRAIEKIGGKLAAVYGEITPRGFTTLAYHIWLNEDDHFADLGSGRGRAVVQAVKDFNVERSVGVELSWTRHAMAEEILMKNPKNVAERIEFVQGDCADEKLWDPDNGPLSSVTCLYVSSLLFSEKLMRRIAQRIVERNEQSDDPCNRLRIVASLREFPPGLLGQGFCKLPAVRCDMSWTEGAGEKVYIYATQ